MGRAKPSVLSRRLVVTSVLLSVFVLFDLFLFGWLILRTLSQREIDRILFETRNEAKDLARRVTEAAAEDPENRDLYVILIKSRLLNDIDTDLAQREEILEVTIYDQDNNLVLRSAGSDEKLRRAEEEGGELVADGKDAYVVTEKIGDVGSIRIGLSPAKMRERTAVLRHELQEQALTIVSVTLLTLVLAYAVMWLLAVRARRSEDQAREGERLAYLGTLAAGLAHEIRNPLNSLNLNMQLLEEEIGPDNHLPTGRRLLSITRQEISRLERLVTDFLLYAKPRPLERQEVAPKELIDQAIGVLAAELRARGARLRLEDSSGGALISVDRSQLVQLLINLLQNGLAATVESPRRPELTVAARLEGDRLALSVADNGEGIPEAEQEKIFEVFYSTRKGGTGLGLAVVQRIASTHGAEIRLHSTPGEGTRFEVLFPVTAMSRAPLLTERPATFTP